MTDKYENRIDVLQKRNKFDFINLLRVMAFFMIALLHAKIFSPSDWYVGIPHAWLTYTPAWAGSWIFFIISGYGIGYGFFNDKYDTSWRGIVRFYISRLQKILPLYYLYLLIVVTFFLPDLLTFRISSIGKILQLIFLNYTVEFGGSEFGAIWFLSTLIKLYICAPIFYILYKKIAKKPWVKYAVMLVLVIAQPIFRVMVARYIADTGVGTWDFWIYVPFYMNFDLFFVGFMLNSIKRKPFKAYAKPIVLVLKILSFSVFVLLIAFNSYIYFNAGSNYSYALIYKYAFPTVYIVVISILIILFEIKKDYERTKLSVDELKHNFMRIIDYIALIAMPLYLFHSNIFNKLQSTVTIEYAQNLINVIENISGFSPPVTVSFVQMMLITLYGLIITFIFAIVFHNLTKNVRFKSLDKLSVWLTNFSKKNRNT